MELTLQNSEVQKVWYLMDVLNWTKEHFTSLGIDSPRLDAELILSHILKLKRIELYAYHDRPLSTEERSAIRELVKRRTLGEPIAYLLGQKEFWSLSLTVNSHVLIPRPDTELIVEEALKCIPLDSTGPILDVGTGSGAIALALASERPKLEIHATDISRDALLIAQKNVDALKLSDRVHVHCSNLLESLPPTQPFVGVVSNLPYIRTRDISDLARDVRIFEPRLALDGGDDGLDLYRALLGQLPKVLQKDAFILLEADPDQMVPLEKCCVAHQFKNIRVIKDLSGLERVLCAEYS